MTISGFHTDRLPSLYILSPTSTAHSFLKHWLLRWTDRIEEQWERKECVTKAKVISDRLVILLKNSPEPVILPACTFVYLSIDIYKLCYRTQYKRNLSFKGISRRTQMIATLKINQSNESFLIKIPIKNSYKKRRQVFK